MPEFHPLFVNQIDILVKPGSDGRFDNKRYQTPTYKTLFDAWEARFKELESLDDALLIYYSDLNEAEITFHNRYYQDDWGKKEVGRIHELKRRFGQKVIVHGTGDYPYPEPFRTKLNENRIQWNPSNVSVWAYGEHIQDGFNLCVASWGGISRSYLGALEQNFRFPIPELSMSVNKSVKINQELESLGWKKALLDIPIIRDRLIWR